MSCIPVLQELSTAGTAVGKLATGDTKGARQVWSDYTEESVLGSTAAAVHAAVKGDRPTVCRYAKGSGRALGRGIAGGGLLSNVPVFKELDKCGKSLGDVIGGGDTESARKRWTKELVEEYSDPNLWAKAAADVAVTGATIGVGMATAGAGSVGVAAAQGALLGATTGMVSNASHQVIDMTVESNRLDELTGEKSNPRRTAFTVTDVVASGITGAAAGAVAGAIMRHTAEAGVENLPDGLDDFRARPTPQAKWAALIHDAKAQDAAGGGRRRGKSSAANPHLGFFAASGLRTSEANPHLKLRLPAQPRPSLPSRTQTEDDGPCTCAWCRATEPAPPEDSWTSLRRAFRRSLSLPSPSRRSERRTKLAEESSSMGGPDDPNSTWC